MNRQTDGPRRPQGAATTKWRANPVDSQVGQSIRAHRLIAGMSQNELARQLGVSFQQVQKYEKGRNRVGAGRLPRIAEILNIPVSAFFHEETGTSAGEGPANPNPLRFITDPNVVKLLNAYAEITDRSTRRHLSELVERIARSATKKSPR
jgi:transcriptional regulator with XRE-family HTH domain